MSTCKFNKNKNTDTNMMKMRMRATIVFVTTVLALAGSSIASPVAVACLATTSGLIEDCVGCAWSIDGQDYCYPDWSQSVCDNANAYANSGSYYTWCGNYNNNDTVNNTCDLGEKLKLSKKKYSYDGNTTTSSTRPFSALPAQRRQSRNNPIINLVNNMLAKQVVKINSLIGEAIIKNNLDPLKQGVNEETSSSVDLGICTAVASAKAVIGDIVGLSSLKITTLTVKEFYIDGAEPSKISLTMKAGVLSGTGSVGVSAGCGFIGISPSLRAELMVESVVVEGIVLMKTSDILIDEFEGKKTLEITVLPMESSSYTISLGLVTVNLDFLPLFGSLLDTIIDLVVEFVKGDVAADIKDSTIPIANNLLSQLFPMSVPLPSV